MSTSPLQFVFRGEVQEIAEIDPTLTVLRWLREQEHAVGTKEGCAEGDCGACTVVLGELDEKAPQGIRYRAVNACILFLPALHGKQLLTVEDLAGPGGVLHPVQRAIVDNHGSQCGFCTPGFVMSLFALYQSEGKPDLQRTNDVLAGNLCRCTGYGPLIASAQTMYDGQKPNWMPGGDVAKVCDLLEGLRGEQTMAVKEGERIFYAPARMEDLTVLLAEHPKAVLLSGGTDVGLWVSKQHRILTPIIYLGRVKELQSVQEIDGWLEIGAGVSYTDAWKTIERHWPDFGELVRRIGSTQIRNCGTIGGNIANGSPVGDTPPALIALGARLVLRMGGERREIPLEDFFIEYGRQNRMPEEFVEAVRVPLPKLGWQFCCYKISKRFDQDISAVCGAFHLHLEDGKVVEARICFGGMAATPKRALATEKALTGQSWTEETVRAGMAAMEQDYVPLSDLRASAAYRMKVAQNLLLKYWLEVAGTDVKTRVLNIAA